MLWIIAALVIAGTIYISTNSIIITIIVTVAVIGAACSFMASKIEEVEIENSAIEFLDPTLFYKDEFDISKVDMKAGLVIYNISDDDYIELKFAKNVIRSKSKKVVLSREKLLVNQNLEFSPQNIWTLFRITGEVKYEYTVLALPSEGYNIPNNFLNITVTENKKAQ